MLEAGPSSVAAAVRHTARVLLIDECQRLLLMLARDPATGEVVWFPPGGGIERGETARQAAAREVGEETGLTEFELGPEVWRRRDVLTWRRRRWDLHERWFLAHVRHFAPDGGRLTAAEREELIEWRWWTLADLSIAGEPIGPRDLCQRVRDLLRVGAQEPRVDLCI